MQSGETPEPASSSDAALPDLPVRAPEEPEFQKLDREMLIALTFERGLNAAPDGLLQALVQMAPI